MKQHGVRRTSARLVSLVGAAAVALVAGTAARAASTYSWSAASPDYYTNAAAWDLGSVPGLADTAVIANGGTALYTAEMTNKLTALTLGDAGANGTITMSGGELDITNTGATAFIMGNAFGSVGTFEMNGGVLTVARPSSGTRYYQDSFQPGYAAGGAGVFTLNNGMVNILCGMEAGINGDATMTVNGGTMMANGWFTFGRGGTSGTGTFNLNGGTVYVLKNGGHGSEGRAETAAEWHQRHSQHHRRHALLLDDFPWQCQQCGHGDPRYQRGDDLPRGRWRCLRRQQRRAGQNDQRFGRDFPNSEPGAEQHRPGRAEFRPYAAARIGPGAPPICRLLTSRPRPGRAVVTFAPEDTRTITLNSAWDGPGRMIIAGPGTVVFGRHQHLHRRHDGHRRHAAVECQRTRLALSAASSSTAAPHWRSRRPNLSHRLRRRRFNSGSALNLNNGAQIIDSTLTIPSGVTLRFNAGNVTQVFTNNVARRRATCP